LNREIEADFDHGKYRHLAFYNDQKNRIEMHLVSKEVHVVRIPALGLSVSMAENDTLWTESSYKFTRALLEDELTQSDFRLDEWYESPSSNYSVALALISTH
jgi:L-histidine N-alpha-methyltransferase